MSQIEIEVRREAREALMIEIKRLRARMRTTVTDPVTARSVERRLGEAEKRLAALVEYAAEN